MSTAAVASLETVFRNASRAFEVGNYTAAASGFLEAYSRSSQPDLLYNAALANKNAGRRTEAAQNYRQYLRLAPSSSPRRGAALTTLRSLAPALLPTLGDELFEVRRFADARLVWEAVRGTTAASAPRYYDAQRAASASSAFVAGRHAEAAEAFEALFVATSNGDLLYNAARAREALGDRLSAISAYAAYQNVVGASASMRASAAERIVALSTPAPTPASTQAPAQAPTSRQRPASGIAPITPWH